MYKYRYMDAQLAMDKSQYCYSVAMRHETYMNMHIASNELCLLSGLKEIALVFDFSKIKEFLCVRSFIVSETPQNL